MASWSSRACSASMTSGRTPEKPRPRPSNLRMIISRTTWRGSGSPGPAPWGGKRVGCESPRRGGGGGGGAGGGAAAPGGGGEKEVGLQLRQPVGGDSGVGEQAEAGVDAVNRLARGDDALDAGGRLGNAPHGSIVEASLRALPQLAERAEIDGFGVELHEVTIGKSRPC